MEASSSSARPSTSRVLDFNTPFEDEFGGEPSHSQNELSDQSPPPAISVNLYSYGHQMDKLLDRIDALYRKPSSKQNFPLLGFVNKVHKIFIGSLLSANSLLKESLQIEKIAATWEKRILKFEKYKKDHESTQTLFTSALEENKKQLGYKLNQYNVRSFGQITYQCIHNYAESKREEGEANDFSCHIQEILCSKAIYQNINQRIKSLVLIFAREIENHLIQTDDILYELEKGQVISYDLIESYVNLLEEQISAYQNIIAEQKELFQLSSEYWEKQKCDREELLSDMFHYTHQTIIPGLIKLDQKTSQKKAELFQKEAKFFRREQKLQLQLIPLYQELMSLQESLTDAQHQKKLFQLQQESKKSEKKAIKRVLVFSKGIQSDLSKLKRELLHILHSSNKLIPKASPALIELREFYQKPNRPIPPPFLPFSQDQPPSQNPNEANTKYSLEEVLTKIKEQAKPPLPEPDPEKLFVTRGDLSKNTNEALTPFASKNRSSSPTSST